MSKNNVGPDWWCKITLIAITSCLLVGCQQTEVVSTESVPVESDRLECLANLYRLHQIQHNSFGPLDRKEFVDFISKQSARSLKRVGVDPKSLDALFVSDIDGEPFEIRYGVVVDGSESGQAIILEAVGVEGKRRVVFSTGEQETVTNESEYEALLAGKK